MRVTFEKLHVDDVDDSDATCQADGEYENNETRDECDFEAHTLRFDHEQDKLHEDAPNSEDALKHTRRQQ